MSYARFGMRCDVYVFLAVEGHLECCSCSIEGTARRRTTAGMLAHLADHVAKGHRVPRDCYEGLLADAAENDAWMERCHADSPERRGRRRAGA